jgi:hypothetical protein
VYVSPGPLAHSGARAFWLGGVCSVGQLSEDGRGTGSVGDVVVERRIRWCYGPCGHCGITRKVRRSAVPVLQLLAVQPPTAGRWEDQAGSSEPLHPEEHGVHPGYSGWLQSRRLEALDLSGWHEHEAQNAKITAMPAGLFQLPPPQAVRAARVGRAPRASILTRVNSDA